MPVTRGGAQAWDQALYQERLADSLYDAVLTALDVRTGTTLLDIAYGSGLAAQRGGAFDVVTSFNGLQFGGPLAAAEAARLLRPGGRIGIGFWEDPGEYGPLFSTVASLAPSPPPATWIRRAEWCASPGSRTLVQN